MPAKSRSARISDVEAALAALPAALAAAADAEASGADESDVRALWERVEMLGATVHRQSRILAGKSRGG
jgi:hypothetical protein